MSESSEVEKLEFQLALAGARYDMLVDDTRTLLYLSKQRERALEAKLRDLPAVEQVFCDACGAQYRITWDLRKQQIAMPDYCPFCGKRDSTP